MIAARCPAAACAPARLYPHRDENHQVSITIGKPFKGGIVGDSLAAFGKTMLAAVGVDAATIDGAITGGKVIGGALA